MNALSAVAIGISAISSTLFCQDQFIDHIHNQVIQTIENSDNIPGLKAEEFNQLKPGIIEHFNELVEKGSLEVTATDKEVRPYFVALQGVIEHVLSCELNKNVKSLTGVIHTPMPATPLCTNGSVSQELVASSVAENPLSLFTVKARTTILRDYLFQGGNLYVVYPKDGIAKRTEAQQQIYKNELNNYPANLFDRPVELAAIDNDLVGAFYLFESAEGKTYVFAIKMTQANDPQDLASFGLWFGPIDQPAVNERVSLVLDTVLKHSSQSIDLPL